MNDRLISELNLSPDLLRIGLQRATDAGQVYCHEGRVARARTYSAERAIARFVQEAAKVPAAPLEVPDDLWTFTPHPTQVEAVAKLTATKVGILTGGPGTGKTTIVQALITVFERAQMRVQLAAPTGKAAIRMAEQCGRPAQTVHRLLVSTGDGAFVHNESNPLPADVVVVDESSMLDVHLAAAVCAAIDQNCRLILVGDADQLPSVDCGRVLGDLIDSGTVPAVRLTQIFRQAEWSRIPLVAREINQGQPISNLHQTDTDLSFCQTHSDEQLVSWVCQAVKDRLPATLGCEPQDIQVLAAQKTRGAGVEALNAQLQATLNPAPSNEGDVPIGSNYTARDGDRVVHVANDYDLGVMNGEMGTVLKADPHGVDLQDYDVTGDDVDVSDKKSYVIVVRYPDRTVAYRANKARQLQLAYALTVHKSQGSQFPVVVFVAPKSHSYMLTRALVYTAITRASRYALVLGDETTLQRAPRQVRDATRQTQLPFMLALKSH